MGTQREEIIGSGGGGGYGFDYGRWNFWTF